jgi:hypothetical protein
VSRATPVCEGTTVVVTWSDERNGAGDAFANRSIDAGATFLATDRRLDTDVAGAATSFEPVPCLEGGVVHVVWGDARTGSEALRYSRSVDAGLTFLAADVPIGNTPAGSGTADWRIACDGARVVIAWEEDRAPLDERDVFVLVSTDGNFTEDRADTDPPGASLSFNPGFAIDGNHLVVCWGEQRDGASQIRTNRTD